MNTTCLINNYNYRPYVGEAVNSALRQTYEFEKVVVVDDGSTDGSVAYLKATFGSNSRVVIVEKQHGGQLSCFNRGIQEVATDLVFFLDADDRYRPEYVAIAVEEYRKRPEVDLLGVSSRVLGDQSDQGDPPFGRTRDLGISVIGALLGGHWVGEKTSCLSMRTKTARQILPYPHESEWITRADDVLVFGSSAVGAYKRVLGQKLVDYRIHDSNYFNNTTAGHLEKINRSLAINRLCHWYIRDHGYELDLLPKGLHREFRTRQMPTFKEWLGYQQIAIGHSHSLWTTCKLMTAMSFHFIKQKFSTVSQVDSTQVGSMQVDSTQFGVDEAPVLLKIPILPFSANGISAKRSAQIQNSEVNETQLFPTASTTMKDVA